MRNPDFIDQQIQACRNAIKYREMPVLFSKSTLGPGLNTGSINDNPAVSSDGNTLVFTERRGLSDVIMFSKKKGGSWQQPRQFLPSTDPGDDCSSCSLNNDGSVMFIYKTDNYDGNIYTSEYTDGNWTPIRKLNENINTRFYESHASVSSDGKKLYFTSNRPGGFGGLDIYVSERDPAGDWGPAVNLGSTINTQYNEDTPFITLNDSSLFFSSEGHASMGGYDIYVAHKDGATWKAPVNLGFPLNTTDDDLFFHPFNNGKNGYYSMATGFKEKDIFYITFGSDSPGEIVEIRGKYSLRDIQVEYDDNYSIHLLDGIRGDTIDVGYPNKLTGHYNFIVAPGKYRLVYTGIGHLRQIVDTTIAAGHSVRYVKIDVALEKDAGYTQAIPQRSRAIYEKINLASIPIVDAIDSSILFRNLRVTDITDADIPDSDVLYYTVQVMALYNPIDVRYFRHVNDIKVMYSDNDKFYRYTTGIFATKDAAYAYRDELMRKGYPDDLFIKKISKY